jgi:hypothetical protein
MRERGQGGRLKDTKSERGVREATNSSVGGGTSLDSHVTPYGGDGVASEHDMLAVKYSDHLGVQSTVLGGGVTYP